MKSIISKFSKIWRKVINLESSLFPELKESLATEEFSHKESKLVKTLDFAQIEKILLLQQLQTLQKIESKLQEHLLQRVLITFK